MRKIIDPFIIDFPSIDIHGFDKEYAIFKIEEFLRDCIYLGHVNCIIIHGKGEGILRQATFEYLRKEKSVLEYKLHHMNEGMTIVTLKTIK